MNAYADRAPIGLSELRIAPHAIDAEQSVLGGLMLSPESLAKVSDWLVEEDFYRKDHRLIFRAVTALIGRGSPVDAVTMGDWFEANGLGDAIGGIGYLVELANSTPSSANIVAYAEIVAEKSRLRSAIDAGTRLTEGAWSRGADSQHVIAEAAHHLAQMQASKMRGGLEPAKVGMKRMQAELMERYKRGPSLLGQPWPWAELNACTKGLRDGVLYIVGARPSMGKALALDTPIPTPSGWSTMGALKIGDLVLGADGKPVEITNATEEMSGRRCYEVEFSDGAVIVADEDHQWLTSTRSARRAATHPKGYEFRRDSPYSRDQRGVSEVACVKTTGEILSTLRDGVGRLNHTVQLASPLQLKAIDLPIDPYILGYWLGDGSSYHANISVGDQDCDALAAKIDEAGYFYKKSRDATAWRFSVSTCPIRKGGTFSGDSLRTRLLEAGLIQNKHIPSSYLRSGDSQRRALLAGLLDSDGTVDRKTGRVCFAVTSKRLATDFRELATTLGYRANFTERKVKGRRPDSSICYMVGFMASDEPVSLPRKAALLKPACSRSAHRTIVAVRPVESVPVRCIEVNNADHMYLAGAAMVPTHNSVFGLQVALNAAINGSHTAFFSVEMGSDECMGRAVACVGEIPHDWVESPNDNDPYANLHWPRLEYATRKIIESPFLIDETPAISITQLMARARRAHMRQPLRLIVVDHIHDMTIDPKQARFEYGLIAQGGKTLAKEFKCPVILLAQLNRQSANRADKRPTMTDLRESGEIEQKADVILFLHREDYYDHDTHLKGVVEVIPAKGRNIKTGNTIYLQNTFSEMRMQDWVGPIPVPSESDYKPKPRRGMML